MNWAESFFSYCWCWRTNLGFYQSDLSGKHCPHLATVMSAVCPCQMIHDNDNDITALLLVSPLLSSSHSNRDWSRSSAHTSCRKQICRQTIYLPLESKVEEKQFLVGSRVRSVARYLQVNLSNLINIMASGLSFKIKQKLCSSADC